MAEFKETEVKRVPSPGPLGVAPSLRQTSIRVARAGGSQSNDTRPSPPVARSFSTSATRRMGPQTAAWAETAPPRWAYTA